MLQLHGQAQVRGPGRQEAGVHQPQVPDDGAEGGRRRRADQGAQAPEAAPQRPVVAAEAPRRRRRLRPRRAQRGGGDGDVAHLDHPAHAALARLVARHQPDDEYGGLSPAGDNNRVVGVGGADHDDAEEGAGETPNPSRLAASVDGAGGFVRSSSSNVLRGLEALGGITSSEEVETDLIEGALPPALRSAARGEWKQMREVELAAEVAGKGNSSSWTWNNPMLLQEEFISMNERHRRESSTTTNPIVVN